MPKRMPGEKAIMTALAPSPRPEPLAAGGYETSVPARPCRSGRRARLPGGPSWGGVSPLRRFVPVRQGWGWLWAPGAPGVCPPPPLTGVCVTRLLGAGGCPPSPRPGVLWLALRVCGDGRGGGCVGWASKRPAEANKISCALERGRRLRLRGTRQGNRACEMRGREMEQGPGSALHVAAEGGGRWGRLLFVKSGPLPGLLFV